MVGWSKTQYRFSVFVPFNQKNQDYNLCKCDFNIRPPSMPYMLPCFPYGNIFSSLLSCKYCLLVRIYYAFLNIKAYTPYFVPQQY